MNNKKLYLSTISVLTISTSLFGCGCRRPKPGMQSNSPQVIHNLNLLNNNANEGWLDTAGRAQLVEDQVEEGDCPICLNSLRTIQANALVRISCCKQIFCKGCLQTSLSTDPRCPLCRSLTPISE